MMQFTNFTVMEGEKTIGTAESLQMAVGIAVEYAQKEEVSATVIAHLEDGTSRKAIFHPDGTNDKIWTIDSGRELVPVVGQVYKNRGGGAFLCMACQGPMPHKYYTVGNVSSSSSAVFQNVNSGWTFTAKGIFQYVDGTIEWSCSVDGRFAPIDNHLNRYFYTFGSDTGFPYQNGWVEVYAETREEANAKFRARFPDRPGHEGCMNYSFCYDEKRWAEMDPEHTWAAYGWKLHEIIG